MNPITKILTAIINGINGMLGGMRQSTIDSIKQGFILFTIVLVIIAIIAGYKLGSKSAKKVGTQIAEETNDVFNIDIKKNRESSDLKSMLGSELIKEMNESRMNKIQFPSGSERQANIEEKIIESDTAKKTQQPLDPELKETPKNPPKNNEISNETIKNQKIQETKKDKSEKTDDMAGLKKKKSLKQRLKKSDTIPAEKIDIIDK